MTIEAIEASNKEFLLTTDVAELLNVNPDCIRYMAHERPELLGFPTMAYRVSGSVTWHVKIPRLGFLHWIKYGKTPLYIPREGSYAP